MLEAVLGLSGLALGGGALWIAWSHALSWLFQAIGGLLLVHRRLLPLALHSDPHLLGQVLHDGAHGLVVALCVGFLVQGGLILLRRLGGPGGESEVGQLAAVTQLVVLGTLLPLSLASAALPVVSRFVAEEVGDDRRTLILMLRLVLLGTAVVGLLGLALGPWAMKAAMGGQYADAGRWLGPALWLILPLGLGHLQTQYLYAQGAYVRVSQHALMGATTLLLALPPLAADWGLGLGAPGALLATALGATVWAASQVGTALGWATVLSEQALVRSGAAVILALIVYVASTWDLAGDVSAIKIAALGAGLAALGLGVAPRERSALWRRLWSVLGQV